MVCNPHFAISLNTDEHAVQYSANHWVVDGPELTLSVRAYSGSEAATIRDSLRANHRLHNVDVPGLGSVSRHRVSEWPGNRPRGWSYWVPLAQSGGGYVAIASDQFVGTDADYAVLRRVMFGEEDRNPCIQQPEHG
jgi:hypothetical protein